MCEWTDMDINCILADAQLYNLKTASLEAKKKKKPLIIYQSLICCSVISIGVISTICASLFSNGKNENTSFQLNIFLCGCLEILSHYKQI